MDGRRRFSLRKSVQDSAYSPPRGVSNVISPRQKTGGFSYYVWIIHWLCENRELATQLDRSRCGLGRDIHAQNSVAGVDHLSAKRFLLDGGPMFIQGKWAAAGSGDRT